MKGNGFMIRIFQIFLIIVNPFFFLSTICERLSEGKPETKVDIEITYLHRYHEDGPQEPDKSHKHKITQVVYNQPIYSKPLIPEARTNNRPTNNNNNGANSRHAYRFPTIDKNAMQPYENEASESPTRMRSNNLVLGQLIHLTTLPVKLDNNSNLLPLIHTACHETINSVTNVWVALVQSGSCPLNTKLGQIRKMHYPPTAVLVYGNAHSAEKQDPYLSFSQEETPMLIYLPWEIVKGIVQRCYNSSGQITIPPELLARINKSALEGPINNQNVCNISIKIYTTNDDNLLSKTSVLFVSISFILLMVISLAWLMFYYVQRFRYIHTKEQFSRRLAHMAKKAVAKIPVKTLKQGDRETDPDLDNCAICIECYKPSDTVRILPCKHYFHKSCIDPWLLEQRSCPMCKLNILHAYGFLPNERGSIISEDHLSDLDSSLELQFMTGGIVPPLPSTSTRVQTYCQARDNNYINVATLPPIFTEPNCRGSNRWSSLLLKRPHCASHRIDRSVSLRHLSGSAEERITFLSENRLLSHSATDTTAVAIQDPPQTAIPPHIALPLVWHSNNNNQISTSVTAAMNPGSSQSTIFSH